MAYKVFLVEDEVTTREGIRDSVDWRSAGFELCGEAPDGEIALPKIEAAQPDVLITDIKMPFMDGLQLCRIIREHMAWVKIIIISGHNDFQYAQTAIKLGVTEYLLKPVGVHDLEAVLAKVAVALDQERSERAYLKKLRSQVEDNLHILREKFLLRLATGGESSISAIEQSQHLGLSIISSFYQVALFEVRPLNTDQVLDYQTFQKVEEMVAGLVGNHNDVLLTKNDLHSLVLILKGESKEQVEQDCAFLSALIREEVERALPCTLAAGAGAPQQRLGDLHQSYAEALIKVRVLRGELETGRLEKLDHARLRRFLEAGKMQDFEAFFNQTIRPLAEAALRSSLLKHYITVDLELTISQFVSDLGGTPRQVMADEFLQDEFWAGLQSVEQIRTEARRLFVGVLAYRDGQADYDRAGIVQKAKAYIAGHFSDPDLSLNEVAAQVGFSPNHFSAVFSAETGGTFRDFLTQTRLEHAQRMLRTTSIKCSDVAYACGYSDPHYFSVIFRKNCGLTPQQFRASGGG